MTSFMKLWILACVMIASSVSAQTATEMASQYTTLHLNESASKQVKKDRINVRLRLTQMDRSKERAQDALNTRMAQVLNELPELPAITINTEGYYVSDDPNKPQRRRDNWEASQDVVLDSADAKRVGEVVAILQGQGLYVVGTYYYVSNDEIQKYRAALVKEALLNAKKRAKSIADTLGLKNSHFSSIRINDPRPMPMHRLLSSEVSAMSSEDAPPPVFEADSQDITVQVNVEVLLN